MWGLANSLESQDATARVIQPCLQVGTRLMPAEECKIEWQTGNEAVQYAYILLCCNSQVPEVVSAN